MYHSSISAQRNGTVRKVIDHENWKCWPVPFIWAADKIIWLKSLDKRNKLWKFFQSTQMNWQTVLVQIKGNGQHLQFRWNELVTIFSSDEVNWWTSLGHMSLNWRQAEPKRKFFVLSYRWTVVRRISNG